jgi:tRNA nucleotidyltransferase (CCA-adding enzyme)
MGRDLVAAGLRPGPDMGRALAYAHELRLAGVEKNEQLKRTMEWIERGGATDA